MALIRSIAFNVIFYLSIFPITSVIIILYPFLSTIVLQRFGAIWIKFSLFLLKFLCGVSWRVEGRENIPKEPSILVSNHQGQWESLFLQTLCFPSTSIVKKEIFYIPFFGWAVACMKPITLDRNNKFGGLKKVLKEGVIKIKKGFSIILFPEGTRISPDKGIQTFASSCGLLSVNSGAPIIPICHNSGLFWRNKRFIKTPGEVIVRIGKPMHGSDAKKLTNDAYEWIKSNYKEIS